MKIRLSQNLKTLRFKSGFSQRDSAELVGIKQKTYAKYEEGLNEPDAKTLVKLSRIYGVSVDALLIAKLGRV